MSEKITLPAKGKGFIAYKSAYTKSGRAVLIRALIPTYARRVVGSHGNKLRCSAARILGINLINYTTQKVGRPLRIAISGHDPDFIYKVGTTAHPDLFNEDPSRQCTNGLHFFRTRKEALGF